MLARDVGRPRRRLEEDASGCRARGGGSWGGDAARGRFRLARVSAREGAGAVARAGRAVQPLDWAVAFGVDEAERVVGTWAPRACSARNARQRVRKSSYHPREGSSGPGEEIATPQRLWWDGYIPGASGWCMSSERSQPASCVSSLMRRWRRLVKPTRVSVRVELPPVGKGC